MLAGVPSIMRAMADTLQNRLIGGAPVRARAMGCHLPEGAVAGGLGDIQARWPDIDIGSYPFSPGREFGTSLVLRGTDEAALDAAYAAVEGMVTGLGGVPVPEED